MRGGRGLENVRKVGLFWGSEDPPCTRHARDMHETAQDMPKPCPSLGQARARSIMTAYDSLAGFGGSGRAAKPGMPGVGSAGADGWQEWGFNAAADGLRLPWGDATGAGRGEVSRFPAHRRSSGARPASRVSRTSSISPSVARRVSMIWLTSSMAPVTAAGEAGRNSRGGGGGASCRTG